MNWRAGAILAAVCGPLYCGITVTAERAVLSAGAVERVIELGEGRAAIVREHLRKCKTCQVLAADIQATVDLLHAASKAGPEQPERLTENRRKKIMWAFTHPMISWMYKHIQLVSLAGAVILFVIVWAFSRFMIESRFAPLKGEPVTVIVVNHGQTNVVMEGTNGFQPEGQ